MPDYLFTGRDAEGRPVTDRITAATVDGARYALETRRYTEIVFHTDDASQRLDATFQRELDPDAELVPLDPEEDLKARRGGGLLHGIGLAVKMHAFLWLPLLVWNLSSWSGARPFGWGDWLGFSLSGLFLVYFLWLVIPGVLFQALLRASVMNRLAETRLWTRVLGSLRFFNGGTFPRFELAVRLACVLARNGRVEEGRALLAPYAAKAETDAMTASRLAGFHTTAREHERAQELRDRALELSQGGIVEVIDHAFGLVRHLRRPAEARASLARLGDRELVEIARIFVAYTEALIALEEQRFAEAVTLFEKTEAELQPLAASELMWAMRRDIWAFQALALAGTGRIAEARTLLARARPLLEARRETELLERCDAVIPR